MRNTLENNAQYGRKKMQQTAKGCEGLVEKREDWNRVDWKRSDGRNRHGEEAYVLNRPGQQLATVHDDDDDDD